MKIRSKTSKLHRSLVIAALIGAQLSTLTVEAQDTNTLEIIKQLQQRIDELEQKVKALQGNKEKEAEDQAKEARSKQRIEELDQKVKVLERDRELDQEAAEASAKVAPKLSLGDQGFTLASANGNFAVQLGGVLQADSRTFFHDAGTVGNDSLLLRRARPILQGTVFRDFDFVFVPDFGGSTVQIFDAYLNYHYSPALQFQAGKFKVPVGLEQLQADRDILFNERSLVTDLVPNRDVGFELHGNLLDGTVSYAAGIFNGVGDARLSSNTSFQDDKSFAGRLFFQPFKTVSAVPALQGLGLGVGGSYDSSQATNVLGLPNTTGGSLPGFTTDGQQQFFSYNPTNGTVVAAGNHWRLSPQGYYYYGPFGLMGEYAVSDQRVSKTGAGRQPSVLLDNTAWEITGSWVLTGEDAAFAGGVVPRHPFDPARGDWGALQLVGRYSELDIDRAAFPAFANRATSARSLEEWAVGLNWYLNRNIKVSASFSHGTFQGGGGTGASAPAIVTRKDENALFTRVQLAF